MSDIKYSFYQTSSGYKISNKTDSEVLLAGGGTKPVAEFTAGLASDANVVHKTGAETIDGIKTFTSSINAGLIGNASTATALQTARTINGTFFNGSVNITTASWGTARTITVGGTAKSVDGSAAVSWSRTEMSVPQSTTTSNVTLENAEAVIGYVSDASLNGVAGTASDGGLYSHVYSGVWKHQIYGDYRTGQIAVRGKNNNVWQPWRLVLDSVNFGTSYADLNAIENLSGTTGLLKKTAANTWALDTNSYLTSASLNGYAQANGANAVGTWATDSNGLFVNGTVGLKTFGPGGTNTSLNDATYGSVAGVINNPGTAAGNPTGDWYHRIKMLHQNTAGYFTEIAVSMTGVPKMHFKQYNDGVDYGWYEAVDVKNFQQITGLKLFRTQGTGLDSVNHFPLQAYAEGGASILPGISFHKGGSHAGAIVLSPNTYEFRNQAGNGLLDTSSRTSRAENGFVHEQYDDPDAVLSSDGSVVYATTDVVRENGELRMQDHFADVSGATFTGSDKPHKLVHLLISYGHFELRELQPGQRIVLINETGGQCLVKIEDLDAYVIEPKEKVTLYVVNAGNYYFYDASMHTKFTF